METNERMGVCAFDTLLKRNVPHILEKIIFSLDYKSFQKCQEVSMTWNQILTAVTFQKIQKYVFLKDIEKDLWEAIWEDNVDEVRRMISNGIVDVNFEHENSEYILLNLPLKTEIGETPSYNAERVDEKVLNQLIESAQTGAMPTWQLGNCLTPLNLAAIRGCIDVVKLLLDAGADLRKVKEFQKSPLQNATLQGHKDVIKVLLDRGGNPDEASRYGSTLLHLATLKGHTDVVKLLLDMGANPNVHKPTCRTSPLHYAARGGYEDMVKLLLDGGAEPNMADQWGRTPLPLARSNGHKDIVNMLRGAGAL